LEPKPIHVDAGYFATKLTGSGDDQLNGLGPE
jgi:hypothetical protein